MSIRNIVRLISLGAALVGVWVLTNSTVWGLADFEAIVASADPALIDLQIDHAHAGAIAAYRAIGAVLLGVGLFRALELPGE